MGLSVTAIVLQGAKERVKVHHISSNRGEAAAASVPNQVVAQGDGGAVAVGIVDRQVNRNDGVDQVQAGAVDDAAAASSRVPADGAVDQFSGAKSVLDAATAVGHVVADCAIDQR